MSTTVFCLHKFTKVLGLRIRIVIASLKIRQALLEQYVSKAESGSSRGDGRVRLILDDPLSRELYELLDLRETSAP